MVPSAAGAVVLIPFPFSDLTDAKLRPAVALARAGRDDWILCQVTSNPYGDPDAVSLAQANFRSGSLRISSFARPFKLFTADVRLIVAEVGSLTTETLQRIVSILVDRLRGA